MTHCRHCGGLDPLASGRSSPDHKRFFALIAAAYENWPEAHEFQPDSREQLRAWLTCKAGYRDATPILMSSEMTDECRQAIEIALNAKKGVSFVVPFKGGVAVVTPKSVAFDKLPQKDFGKLRDDVSDIIESVIGCKVEDLMREVA